MVLVRLLLLWLSGRPRTRAGLAYAAEELGLPISQRATLFSTPEVRGRGGEVRRAEDGVRVRQRTGCVVRSGLAH